MRERVWTEDKLNWLIESKSVYDDREDILNAFNKHFKTNINLVTLRDINTKKQLCLPKAHRAINTARDNLKVGWIKIRGFETKEIGEEINFSLKEKPYIKVSNEKDGYVLKHRHLYEQYHNVELDPIEDIIVFLDDDTTNYSKENLYRLKRKTHAIMVNHRLYGNKSIDKLSLIKFCEWKEKIIERE